MSKFVLTAQLQLQAPRNTRQVVTQMQQQLGNAVNIPVNPVINNQALANANAQLTKVSVSAQSVSKNLGTARKSADSFGAALGAAARRFASITLATGFFLGITRAMGSAVGRAVEFEKEMLKISQVTGKSIRQLSELSNEVTRLATTFGVSSEEILNSARTLTQAGFAAKDVTKAIEILAQTDLAATFDNISDTTEGAVAILRQFRGEVRAAGGEVQFLRQAMDAINAVSKNFAVESADLISVVRRTGGVFEAAGGKLNELIALFTSVRGTTRETADTIATGFRTIFTRIQRTETIDQLRELGIVLQDSTGKFVGPLEAIKRLSIGLSALDPRDFRFNEIVEQLGGFRQIGKVIPLIKQYETSTAALAIANDSLGSTAQDAAIAQQGLGNQFAQLKEKFDATMRSLVGSDTFQNLAASAITFAESILKIVEALEPLLPMLTALAAFKLGQIAVPAFGRFAGIGGRNQGGRIHAFNSGGFVPGTGNRDTVPAMLTPGEFVIRKSSVKKIGAQRLAQMNGYNKGGSVYDPNFGAAILTPNSAKGDFAGGYTQWTNSTPISLTPNKGVTDPQGQESMKSIAAKVRKKVDPDGDMKDFELDFRMASLRELTKTPATIVKSTPNATVYKAFIDGIEEGISQGTGIAASYVAKKIPNASYTIPEGRAQMDNFMASINEGAKGNMFEQVMDAFGEPFDDRVADPRRPFDYTPGQFEQMRPAFAGILASAEYIDAKASQDSAQADSMRPKVINQRARDAIHSPTFEKNIIDQMLKGGAAQEELTEQQMLTASLGAAMRNANFFGGKIGKYNKGGSVDTVPAMLTPGEYVINKKAAQEIGYGNLNRMNKSGVAHFNTGGPVQFFNKGTTGAGVPGGAGMNVGANVNSSMEALASSATRLSYQLETISNAVSGVIDDFNLLGTIDDKVLAAVQPLSNAIAEASQGVSSVDNKLLSTLTAAVSPLYEAIANAASGISALDNILLQAFETAVVPLNTAMVDASAGISKIDETLNKTIMNAVNKLTTPMEKLVQGIEKTKNELTEVETPLTAMKQKAEALNGALNKLAESLTEKIDDLNPVKTGASNLSIALVDTGAAFKSVVKRFASQVMSGARTLSSSLTKSSGATNISTHLSNLGPQAERFGIQLAKGSSATIHFTRFMGSLNGALVRFETAIINAMDDISKMGLTGGGLNQKLLELEMRIEQLEQQLAKMTTQAAQAGNNLAKTGTTAAASGAAAAGGGGAMMMGNQLAMFGMMAGMMVTQFMDMEEATRKATDAAIMVSSIFAMLGLQVLESISSKVAEAGASKTAAMADTEEAAASQASAAASLGAVAGMMALSVVVGVIAFKMIKASAAAEELSKGITETLRDFSRGEGTANLDLAQAQAKQALLLEAQAAATWGGAVKGLVAGVGIAILAVSAIATAGATAALFIAAAGAGIGAYIGEAGATIAAGLGETTSTFVTAAYLAAQALNEFGATTKEIATLELDGAEKLQRQIEAGQKLATETTKATTASAIGGFQLSGLSEEELGSKTLGEIIESSSEMLSSAAEQNFQSAQDMASGAKETARRLREEGKSFEDIMANADVQSALTTYTNNIYAAVQAQSLLNGTAEKLARERLNLTGVSELEMTVAQKRMLAAETAAQAEFAAAQASEEHRQAIEERMKAEDEAARKAKESADQRLAADRQLAMQAAQLTADLNTLSVSLIGLGTQLGMMELELGSLTGSIKQYKNQNVALIGTLQSGQVTDESAAAARSVGDRFGIRNEVNQLLSDIESSEELRQKLTNQGLEQLKGELSDPAISGERLDDFLRDAEIDLSGLSPEIRAEILDMLRDGLKPEEIETIIDMVNGANEERIKVLQDLAKAEQQYLNGLFNFGTAIVKSQNDYMKSLKNLAEAHARGAERIAQAEGRELTVQEVAGQQNAIRQAGMGAVGLAGGAGVQGTAIQFAAVSKKMKEADAALRTLIEGGADQEDIIKLQNAQKDLANQANVLKNNLKELANQAKLAAAIMGEIELERSKREAVQGLISEFTFATNEQRMQMNQSMMALQRVLQTGTLASIPDEMRGAVGGLLDQLKDIELLPGMTGADVKKRLEIQTANQMAMRTRGFGLLPEEIKRIFERTTKEDKLINDLRALNREEQQAAKLLADIEAQQMQNLIQTLNKLADSLAGAMINVGAPGAFGGGGAGNVVAGPNARGGWANLNKGGDLAGLTMVDFKKQGPDVIPAMLSKGEFVVNPKAAKRNAGILEEINSNKVSYFKGGGWTDGTNNPQTMVKFPLGKTRQDITDKLTGYGESFLAANKDFDTANQKYTKEQQDRDMGQSFGNKDRESNLYWMNEGKRKAVWDKYYDKMKDTGRQLTIDTESTGLDEADQKLFMMAKNIKEPWHYLMMQKAFVASGRNQGGEGLYMPSWWKKNIARGLVNNMGPETIKKGSFLPWEGGFWGTEGVNWGNLLDDLLYADISRKAMADKFGGIKKAYTQMPMSDLFNFFSAVVPFNNEPPYWETHRKAIVHARSIWQSFNKAYEKKGGFYEALFPNYQDVSWDTVSTGTDKADTLELYGGSKSGFVADGNKWADMLAKGPSDDLFWRLATVGSKGWDTPAKNIWWRTMNEYDWVRYATEGMDEASDLGSEWYNRNLALLPVKQYRDNIFKKYDYDLSQYLDSAKSEGRIALKDFYSTFDADAEGDAKKDQQRKLQAIIGNIQAIQPPVEVTKNQLGKDKAIDKLFNETARKSLHDYAGDVDSYGAVSAQLDYVPWDATTWGAPRFSDIYQDTDNVRQKANKNIADAQAIYKKLNSEMTPKEVADSLDSASKILRNGDVSGAGANFLNNVLAAAVAEEKPVNEEVVDQVIEADVDAIVKKFKSPFMSDDQKKQGLIDAWAKYNEAAKKAKLAGNRPLANTFMRIAPIFDYIRRNAKEEGVDIPDASRYIGQLPASAGLFNAMFPFLSGSAKSDASKGVFGSIESQLREAVKYNFLTGLDEKGPIFNSRALQNRGMQVRVGPMGFGQEQTLKIGKDTDAMIKLLYHWVTSDYLKFNQAHFPTRQELAMMGQFFNMANVTDAFENLEKASLLQFNGLVNLGNKVDAEGNDIEGTSGMDILTKVLGEKTAKDIQKKIGPAIAGFATGGHVGGVHMKPSASDTVPAMLTPGEFVMQKSAVDKYGVGFMQRINAGKGSTGPYFQEGGGVERPRPGTGDPQANRLAQGSRDVLGRGSMDLGPKIDWPQGLPVNIGDLIKKFDLYASLERFKASRNYSEAQLEYARKIYGIDDWDKPNYAYTYQMLAQGFVEAERKNYELLKNNILTALGGSLSFTQMVDVGQLLEFIQRSNMGAEMPTVTERNFGIRLNTGVGRPETFEGLMGYVTRNLLFGEPLATGDGAGLGYMHSDDFGMMFGEDAQKKYFPAIDQKPATWGGHNYTDKNGWLLSDGKFHALETRAREIRAEAPRLTDKFANDVTALFNYISRQAFADAGIDWDTFGVDDQKRILLNSTGAFTGVIKKARQEARVIFAGSWSDMNIGLPDNLKALGDTLDRASAMISSQDLERYRAAKVNAYDNAYARGMQILKNLEPDRDPAVGVLQRNSGGGVPGSGNRDTVPAMLTPGEFVMRKSAVQKYGLGFMRAINDSSPSVRVGRGVQYKHEGDVMGAGSSIDFSGLSNSISQLGNQVSTSLSAFETAFLGFSKLSSMISDTINSIANLNITHTVNISGSLSIPGFSQQAIDGIVKVISEQITNSTDGKIRRALRKFKRDQDNRT